MKLVEGFTLRNIMGQPTIIGEGVAQVDFNKLITLNQTAAFLWEQLEGKEFALEDVVSLLMDTFAIDRELAEKDAESICRKWIELGLAE